MLRAEGLLSYPEPAVVCFIEPQYLCCYRERRRCPKYNERFKLSIVSVVMVTWSACIWTLKVDFRPD